MNSKIVRLFGLMIGVFLLNACVDSGVKVKNTSANSLASSNLPSSATTCTVGQSEQVDCTNEKSGAAIATRSLSCIDTGTGAQLITGSCFIESCVVGSTLVNNYCVLNNTNTCLGNSAQTCSIANGSGIQSRTCTSGVWSPYGSCVASSCNQGYRLENNICVSNTCVGSSTQPCTVVNGQGVQSRTCTNGVWSTFGVCSVSTCNTGYIKSGNSCVVASCVGSASTQLLPDLI